MSAVNVSTHDDRLQQTERELAFARDCLSRFGYALSHELNSPITTLSKLLEIFRDENHDQLDTAAAELLDVIMQSAERTHNVVSGILEYSECSKPRGGVEEVDSALVLADVLNDLDGLLQQNNALVEIGDMPVFRTHANSLKHIFRQLVSNALKFCADDKPPKVIINAQPDHNGVEFIVSDSGLGIPHERDTHIFELFSRLHATSDFDGTGLGLPIALQAVQALNGRMWVNQTDSGGSAFHFYLPFES